MGALTEWSLGLQELADGTATPLDESRLPWTAFGPLYSNPPPQTKTEYNTGLEGGRVLTEDEIKNGWVDATGRYHQGRKSFGDYGMSNEDFQNRHAITGALDFYFDGLDKFSGPYAARELSFVPNAVVLGEDDGEWSKAAIEYMASIFGSDPRINALGGGSGPASKLAAYNKAREANYNPFLGSRGGMQDGSYRDDSVAAYFKNAFDNRITDRSDAYRALQDWNQGGNNLGSMAMTQAIFDQMNLADKFGLSYGQASNNNNNDLVSGDGMLSYQDSSWQDVLNRGGASLENWDSLLGQYTYDSPLNWASMSDQEVENSFGNLFDNGGMFTQGKNRDLIYATLLENLGRG
jgi:hypothetical protein